VVHHWELSVKFLLYVGPWEALGLTCGGAAEGESVWIAAGEQEGERGGLPRLETVGAFRDRGGRRGEGHNGEHTAGAGGEGVTAPTVASAAGERCEATGKTSASEDPAGVGCSTVAVLQSTASVGVTEGGPFLGLFLGPHVGVSLQNRKDRLVSS